MIRIRSLRPIFLLGVLFAVWSGPTIATAENAFRWEDAAGHVFYGSSPPKAARNVTKLGGKGFSRYSSDKLLRPYQARAAYKNQQYDIPSANSSSSSSLDNLSDVSSDPSNPPVVRAGGSIKEQDAIPDPQNPDTFAHFSDDANSAAQTAPSGVQYAQLIQGKLAVKTSGPTEISSCDVGFRNSGVMAAKNVHVSFEFPDGTLIPADGPEIIASNSVGSFSIPDSQLPVRLKAKPDKPLTDLTPKVVVTADNLAKTEEATN